MKRTALNFWTDAFAFIGFLFLTTSGILLRYQLPPGSGRTETVGQGARALTRPVSVLWGLTRHEWGDIHYYIALTLMAVLTLHLFLHWKWIVCVARGKPAEGSGYRLALGVVGLISVLALAVAPLWAPPVKVPRSQLQSAAPDHAPADETTKDELIRGDMTLAQMEAATGVPASYILERLGLPPTTSRQDQIGRLRRQHGFQMQDVRQIVSEFESP